MGLSDKTSALLAFRAASVQIILYYSTELSLQRLKSPLSTACFLESRYLTPSLITVVEQDILLSKDILKKNISILAPL